MSLKFVCVCVSGVGWEVGLAWDGFKLTTSGLSFHGQILRGQVCVTVPGPEFQFFSVLVSHTKPRASALTLHMRDISLGGR